MNIGYPNIVTLYAALLGLFYIYLTAMVIRGRWVHKVPIGEGKNAEIKKPVRVHANFNEYVPMALILMVLVEVKGAQAGFMHALGISLLFGRFLHAYGLGKTHHTSKGRFIGSCFTYLVIIVASVNLLIKYFN